MKILGWSLVALLALLLLVGAVIGTLLGTAGGSRWLLAQAPGVQVDGFQGRLGGRWQAEQLRWSQADDSVVVKQPRLDWSAACLLRMTLCIDELAAESIELVFPPGTEEAPSEPFSLPDLKLPLELQVLQVDLGPLRLNGEELLQSLQLRADWRRAGLDIRELRASRADMKLSLAGRLQPSGAWPLSLQGDAALQIVDEQPWTLQFDIQGELRESLALNVDSDGYLDGNLSGQLQPLATGLPATLKLTLDGFKASPDLPDSLRLDGFVLTAEGALDEGYRLLASGRLAGEGGAVALQLDGLVNQAGARVDRAELVASERQRVGLTGHLDWREALQGEASLQWQDFPWWRLYPQPEPPPVTLRTLTAQLQYDAGNYLGHFDAAMSGPAGDFTLKSPVSGDLQRVHLPQLELQAGQGGAAGNLSVGFADGIDWRTALALRDVDPSYWLAELPGKLGGTLESQGALRDEQLEAHVALAMDGRLRGQPARLQLEASGREARWELPTLDLQLGDNRIQGSGQWTETLQGQLRLELTRLAQLWPELGGRLSGDLSIAGTPAAPQGRLELQGQTIRYQDNHLQRLQLAANLADGERARLRMTVDGITSGDTELGQLQLNADGTLDAHQAALQLQGGLLDLSLAAEGGMRGGDWRGRLLRAAVDAYQQQWALQQPVAIERLANGWLDLAAHCFASGPATLCAPAQRLMPDTQLRYRLRDFPLESLAANLPDTLAWQGELNADLQLELPQAGPNGEISVNAGPGVLRFREEDIWHDFPYQTLALNSRLRPERIDSRLHFVGGELGELDVQLRIDPQGEIKPIDGEFSLRDLDISVARPFVPQVDRLQGQLNGAGRLSGTLQSPQLNGDLRLSEAEISGSELPVSFERLQVDIGIEGQQLRIDGNWRSGEQGQGRLNGTLDWQQALDLDLHLAGTRLPVVVEPYAELEVEPDLHLVLADERLAVSGRIKVPRGDITVRELPPSTVKVSEDTVIVGEEAEQADTALAIGMDIDVEVGEDRLRFSGFGLTADLAGYLHIGDNLDARGELKLNNGRYRAYGQRLTIRRAQLLFTGVLTQPFLDIEAIRRIPEDDVVAGLRITGSAEQPRIQVFAEPAMSQEQALSYLVLGRALGADSGDSNLLANAALSLGLAGSASFTGDLANRLGIDDFQLDTEGSGANTSVVASGRLTERLTLRYGVGVFEPANTVALRYRLTRRIFLEAASGLASSLDLFYRRNF